MTDNTPSQDSYAAVHQDSQAQGFDPRAAGAAFGLGVQAGDLGFLMDVELRVSVELGRCKMRIDDLLKLGPGGIIKLDKLAGEPLDVRVNDRLIAHGEAVVLGEKFGIRLVDLVARPDRF